MSESNEEFVKNLYPKAMVAREVGGKWTVFDYMGGEEIGSDTTPNGSVVWGRPVTSRKMRRDH